MSGSYEATVKLTVLIAKLNRDSLRALASDRIEEARILLEHTRWTGAYYLTGLGIECALKSCLAGAVREHDFLTRTLSTQCTCTNLKSSSG